MIKIIKNFFLNSLNASRALLYRFFAGKGIGKKFPFLWRIYDFFFCLFSEKRVIHEVNGVKLLIDLQEPNFHFRRILEDYSTIKEYEPNTIKVMMKNIKEGNICLDIGASIGIHTFLISKLVGKSGRVYAFEPTPECFRYLCENKKINNAENVFVYQLAAWDKNDIVKIQPSLKRRVYVTGIKLDDWLNFLGAEKVNFIKIDIDGGELFALKGLVKTIKSNPGLKMIIEYYPQYIKKMGADPQEFLDFLNQYFYFEKIFGDYGDNCYNLYCERK